MLVEVILITSTSKISNYFFATFLQQLDISHQKYDYFP